MNNIAKTNDSTLDALLAGIERHVGRKIIPSRFNRYVDTPALHYMALTHIQYATAKAEAELGAITEDTLMNPRIKDNVLYGEVRFGNQQGHGIGYNLHPVPLKRAMSSLAERIDLMVDGSSGDGILRNASDSYDEYVSSSHWDSSVIVPNLSMIRPIQHLEDTTPLTKKLIPTQKLLYLAKTCSGILSEHGNDGKVTIQIHDEIRRLATSEGTIIRDGFFGYSVMFEVETRGGSKKDAPMSFYQSLYFTNEDTNTIEKKMLSLSKWMLKEVDKRKKVTAEVTNGLYPALLYPGAMATQLHECLVHFLASDEILENDSTTLGWENYGKMCTNPNLNVYSDPGLEGKWGSMNFDHEGIPASKRILVENGVVRGYLADRNGAYHLSRLTGAEILPGDARIGYPSGCNDPVSQPRISNLEFGYDHGSDAVKTKQQMFNQFVKYLQENKIEKGILIPDSSGAASWPEEGFIEANPHFPYIVTANGETYPTRFITTRSDVHSFLNNIITMDGASKYTPHQCGVGEEESWRWVRAGINCGTGIVKDLHIHVNRPEELRQPRLK